MRPADDYEDPRDIQEIQLAKEKIGDYKLKSATNYVIPESMKLNTSEVKHKLLNLVDHHINGNLPLNEYGIRLYIEELDDDEYPERILSFTECILPEERYDWKEPKIMKEFCNTNNSSSNDVTNTIDVIWFPLHCLASDHYYITILNNTDQKYSLLKSSLCSMIDEMSISNNGTVEEDHQGNRQQDTDGRIKIPIVHPIRPDKINSYIMDKNNKIEDINLNEDNSINQSTTISSPSSLTPLEIEYNRQKHIKAIYYRNHLLQLASRFIRCFDIEVRLLRHKRFQLGVLLKRSELYQYTLYNEYCLLKEFEKSEYVLMEKMKNRLEEKQDITNKVNELTLKLEQKKKDLERLSQREHQIHEEFKTSLDDSHKFIEFLTKIPPDLFFHVFNFFQTFQGSEDESEESTSSSSSSDDSSYEEMDDESENEDVIIMDLDTCPPGCPMEDFERTCLIREKRLDVEEEMTEEKKTLDILRKDLEIFTKKQRIVETTLKQAQNELEAFQLEKQRKLNELEIIVIIRLDQIKHFVNDTIPSDMTNSLIFLKNNLHTLQKRIHELEIEQKQQRIERKQAKLHHLIIDDIEKMENIMVNPKLEDLTTKMLVLQEEFAKEEAKIESKIRDVRDSCMEQIRQNTVYLKKLLTLFNENQQLQNDLNQINSTKIGTIQSSPGIVDHKQLKQLVQLVKLQSEEINSLTQEIQQLSR
ncbi:putative protein C10orf118 (CTCL tumor antigen HD-CL-01/L14-2) [Schistosoma mansoni]|uniref:putative protein C10orf118 (CTCL tumor antigen HD-CL-01/L14-2) n=1 Tax=Schistosoma mansoni TaxID=6183 RepID=UPI0001A62E83|nr:putative protein C10orf118 (CTCL tumor antigen HD-CL-01/L14-2) [Schistosoma mansoni]|eukprot:XP_018652485.1 putative protein C10orf118 (CTCL tumor antigen HD-CL-01/L14-2) [Schistosoma mansoni]